CFSFSMFSTRAPTKERFRRAFQKWVVMGSDRFVARAACSGDLYTILATGIFDNRIESRRLAHLHRSRKFGAVAARTEQGHNAQGGNPQERSGGITARSAVISSRRRILLSPA